MKDGSQLRRTLGLRDALCVVIGAIIGVGIFFTPARVASVTGSEGLAILAWGIGGGIAFLGALTFAELGGMYPSAGGQYSALRDAFGTSVAFVYGFSLMTAIQSGAVAIIGIVCAQHLGLAIQGEPPAAGSVLLLSGLLIVGLTVANALGVRWGAAIQNVTVYVKVATLLVVAGVAAWHGGPSDSSPPPAASLVEDTHGWMEALFVALSPVLFSFGGWQQGTWVAGEVREARRNVPAAIIIGVLIVIVVYILANLAFFSLLGFAGVKASGTPAADAVETVAGSWGSRIIAGAIAVSAFGVMNAQLLSGPRYIYAMARDGRFFKAFDHLHDRFQTPARAIALLGGLSLLLLVMAGKDGLDRLLNGVVFVDWVFFAMTGAAVVLLRRKLPHAPRSVRVPGYPVTPVLFVLFSLAAVAGSFLDEQVRSAAVIGLVWIALGVLFSRIFLWKARARSR